MRVLRPAPARGWILLRRVIVEAFFSKKIMKKWQNGGESFFFKVCVMTVGRVSKVPGAYVSIATESAVDWYE
jgi:hypothetical protein